MGLELINSSSHNNQLAVYKFISSNQPFYAKVSFTEESNDIIKTEHLGYSWFFEKIHKQKCPVILIKNHYHEILIPVFEGFSFTRNAKLGGNESFIEKLIIFYKNKWPIDDNFCIHGDLALCNVIFRKEKIYIIDWEHFHESSMEFYGLDIINMLYITLATGNRKIRHIKKKSLDFIKECYNNLFEGFDQMSKIIEKPFQSTSEYIKYYQRRFETKRFSKEKFAIANCSLELLMNLDLTITRI